MKDFFEEGWIYKLMVILCLCIFLVHIYINNQTTINGFFEGEFKLNAKLIWQLGILTLLALVLFYLLESVLDYKSQNDVLKEYIKNMQNDLKTERDALKDYKTSSGDKILRLGSFIVTISDMAKEVNSVLETAPLLETILAKTAELLGSKKCAVFTLSSDRKNLNLVDAIGYDRHKLSQLKIAPDENSGIIGLSVSEGKFYSKSSIEDDYNKKHILAKNKFETQFCQPIMYGKEVLAVICVGDVREGLLDEHVIRILSTMANFGAVALTNTNLVEKIKEQSVKDGLTQLCNHQHFQERLEELLDAAIKKKKPLGLIMIDLDHFKKLNDNFGHQMGDLGLTVLARILTLHSKKDDVAARYGGEEFAFITPGLDLEQTEKLAESLREGFKKEVLEYEGSKTKCTLSAGVAAYLPGKTEDIKRNILIRIADKALYEAKGKGRDRVAIGKGV